MGAADPADLYFAVPDRTEGYGGIPCRACRGHDCRDNDRAPVRAAVPQGNAGAGRERIKNCGAWSKQFAAAQLCRRLANRAFRPPPSLGGA